MFGIPSFGRRGLDGTPPGTISSGAHVHLKVHGLNAVETLLTHTRTKNKGRQEERLIYMTIYKYNRICYHRSMSCSIVNASLQASLDIGSYVLPIGLFISNAKTLLGYDANLRVRVPGYLLPSGSTSFAAGAKSRAALEFSTTSIVKGM